MGFLHKNVELARCCVWCVASRLITTLNLYYITLILTGNQVQILFWSRETSTQEGDQHEGIIVVHGRVTVVCHVCLCVVLCVCCFLEFRVLLCCLLLLFCWSYSLCDARTTDFVLLLVSSERDCCMR